MPNIENKQNMRTSIFIFMTFFLQSCAATKIIINKVTGQLPEFYANDVINAYFDSEQRAFTLCVTDSSLSGKNDRFTLKIPDEIAIIEKDDRFKVSEIRLKENKNLIRENIKTFQLNAQSNRATVEAGCDKVPHLVENLAILRAPKDLPFLEAATFKGKAINALINESKPFLIFIPDYPRPDKESFLYLWWDDRSPCDHQTKSCIILVKQNKGTTNSGSHTTVNEIVSINQLTRKIEPKPFYAIFLPFAIIMDTVTSAVISTLEGGCCPPII